MKGLTLACFFLLVLLILGFLFTAFGSQTNWPAARPSARAVEVRKNKLIVKRDKKAEREFPLMFDIADRSRKHKAGKKK